MISTKFWDLGFYQHRGKADKIKVEVKIKSPDNVEHAWVHQVACAAPKGKAIFTKYNRTVGNTTT